MKSSSVTMPSFSPWLSIMPNPNFIALIPKLHFDEWLWVSSSSALFLAISFMHGSWLLCCLNLGMYCKFCLHTSLEQLGCPRARGEHYILGCLRITCIQTPIITWGLCMLNMWINVGLCLPKFLNSIHFMSPTFHYSIIYALITCRLCSL